MHDFWCMFNRAEVEHCVFKYAMDEKSSRRLQESEKSPIEILNSAIVKTEQ